MWWKLFPRNPLPGLSRQPSSGDAMTEADLTPILDDAKAQVDTFLEGQHRDAKLTDKQLAKAKKITERVFTNLKEDLLTKLPK